MRLSMSVSHVHNSFKDVPKSLTFFDQILTKEIVFSDERFLENLNRLSENLNTHLTFHHSVLLGISKKNVSIKQILIDLKMDYSTEEDFNSVRNLLLRSMTAELEKKEVSQTDLINFLKNRINLIHLFNQLQSVNLYKLRIDPPFLKDIPFEPAKLKSQNIEEGLKAIHALLKEADLRELECAIKLSWRLNNVFKQMIEVKGCAKRITIDPNTSRATLSTARLFFKTG